MSEFYNDILFLDTTFDTNNFPRHLLFGHFYCISYILKDHSHNLFIVTICYCIFYSLNNTMFTFY